MAVNEGRLLGGQHPLTMCLEQALGCTRRLCRRVECPAEMLARMAPADGPAVMRQHIVIELADDPELRGELGARSRVGRRPGGDRSDPAATGALALRARP